MGTRSPFDKQGMITDSQIASQQRSNAVQLLEDSGLLSQNESDSRRRRKRRGQIQPATILGDNVSASSTQTLLGA